MKKPIQVPRLGAEATAQGSILTTAAIALLLMLFVSACATTPEVQTKAEAGSNFSGYKTFALLPLPTTGPASDPGLMERISRPAHDAVVQALTAKGLSESSLSTADLAVHLQGQSIPKTKVTDWGYKPGPTYNGRVIASSAQRDVDVEKYDERTLTIDLLDNRTKEQVWTGAMSANTTGPVQVSRLQEAIHQILAKYPGGAKR